MPRNTEAFPLEESCVSKNNREKKKLLENLHIFAAPLGNTMIINH